MFGDFGVRELSLIVALCVLLGVASRLLRRMWKPGTDARDPTSGATPGVTRPNAYIERLFGRAR